jgi:hypothetical protein
MQPIGIGLPLVQGVHGYEEGVHYNYTFGGHTLRIAVTEPCPSQAYAVQHGQALFALAHREEAIFILSRFGDLPWTVSHYNWWTNPPVMRPDPWMDMKRMNGGVRAGVCLVNASNGIVAALRTVRLSPELSRVLIAMVQVQMKPAFDPWRYLEVVGQTFDENPDAVSLLKGALCMCEADLPPDAPFLSEATLSFH